jgi:3-methyladenine DNA glycosylase/8-oxoguanine DNA glycosylase
MIKATKITDEEFNQVNELRREYQIIALELGELNLIERNLKLELEKVQEDANDFYSSYLKLQDKEKDFIDKLNLTYSNQTINFETGELS